jgi:hypothetical protein
MTPRRLVALIITLPALQACYQSAGHSDRLDGDSTTQQDVPRDDARTDPDLLDLLEGEPDVVLDPDLNAEEEEIEPFSCLYGPTGARQITEEHSEHDAPQLFWNGSEVGVVPMDSGGDWTHIFVGLINVAPDLSSQSDEIMVGEESHGWGEPAWTGEALGLCWHSDPGMVGRTAFRLLDREGGQIGPRADLDYDGEACLDLAFGAGRFLASWRHWTQVGEDFLVDTRIQMLDGQGNPHGEPMDVARNDYPGPSPSLIYNGSEFLAAIGQNDEVRIRWINAEGQVVREQAFSAPMAAHCAVAQQGDRIAVAWATGERYQRDLHVRVFDTALLPVAGEFIIAPEGAGAADPDLHAGPDGWVLTWYQGPSTNENEISAAYLLHLDLDGMPRQPRLVLHEGPNSGYGGPDMAVNGTDLWVGISHYPSASPGWEQVFVLRYGCAEGTMDICAPQDASLPVVCDDGMPLGWKWNGTGCEELVGCETDCVGADCDSLALTEWDCRADRFFCLDG